MRALLFGALCFARWSSGTIENSEEAGLLAAAAQSFDGQYHITKCGGPRKQVTANTVASSVGTGQSFAWSPEFDLGVGSTPAVMNITVCPFRH